MQRVPLMVHVVGALGGIGRTHLATAGGRDDLRRARRCPTGSRPAERTEQRREEATMEHDSIVARVRSQVNEWPRRSVTGRSVPAAT